MDDVSCMWKHWDRTSFLLFFLLHMFMSLLFRFWCTHRCFLYSITSTASICLPMKFSVQFSLVSASLLYLCFICILTLFLELMYFTTQQVSYHSTLPCSVYLLLLLFLKCEWSFCVPSIHWLPTYFSIRIVIVLADWHTTASILARFWWSVRDGDLSSRKFFWGGFHNHIPQPQVPTNHFTPLFAVALGRSVASTVSDKLPHLLDLSTQWSSSDWVFDGQVGFEVFETAGWFLLPATMQGCFTSGEHSACWNRAWQRKT